MLLKIKINTWTKSDFVDIQKITVEPVWLLKWKILTWILEDRLHKERVVFTDSCQILSLKVFFILLKVYLPCITHLKGVFIKATKANKNTLYFHIRKKSEFFE